MSHRKSTRKGVLAPGLFGKALDGTCAGVHIPWSPEYADLPLPVELWVRPLRTEGFFLTVESWDSSHSYALRMGTFGELGHGSSSHRAHLQDAGVHNWTGYLAGNAGRYPQQ